MAKNRPQNNVINKVTIIIDKPATGSSFLILANDNVSLFFNAPREFVDDPFALATRLSRFETEFEIVVGSVGLGLDLGLVLGLDLTSGEPG